MLGFLRRNQLTGILAVTPLVPTVWVLRKMYGLIAGFLCPLPCRLRVRSAP